MISIPLTTFENRQLYATPWNVIPLIPGLIIAGGSCRKLFLGQIQDSDIDVFADSKPTLDECMTQMLAAGFKVKWGNETVTELVRETVKVQLIGLSFFKTPEELFASFDFTICQFGLNAERTQLVATDAAVIDAGRKRLVVNKVTYAVATLKRLEKYKSQGFMPCNGTYRDLVAQIKQNDVNLVTAYID